MLKFIFRIKKFKTFVNKAELFLLMESTDPKKKIWKKHYKLGAITSGIFYTGKVQRFSESLVVIETRFGYSLTGT